GAAFYGQISRIGFLPVIEDWVLRAEFKKRLFARNRELPFTTGAAFYGQISRIGFLPVIEDQLLRANLKNRLFARNQGLPFTGRIQKTAFCP
ncbi:hypothetical protein, partial [Ligilactobacillus ruminis]|uniref:hypothetical protein n=1 Tax=Ligilactobacillus ruminis TaxID=1623 RepID=UPI0022E3314E